MFWQDRVEALLQRLGLPATWEQAAGEPFMLIVDERLPVYLLEQASNIEMVALLGTLVDVPNHLLVMMLAANYNDDIENPLYLAASSDGQFALSYLRLADSSSFEQLVEAFEKFLHHARYWSDQLSPHQNIE